MLGPVEVVVGGEPVALGGPRPRAVLGVLLAAGGRPVRAERLIDELWGEQPPATATAALQVHVAALRKVLPGRIETTPAGYRLDLTGATLDTDGVEDAIRTARDLPPAAAAERLAGVLARWRGPAYGGVPAGPAVDGAAAKWDELRLAALDDRITADLAAGRHAELLAELAELTAAHPTRERPARARMLAAYRAGRTGEALAAYRALADALDAELGVAPGAETEALARAVERGDPTLATPAPAGLPVPASRFVGRRRELAAVGELLGRSRMVTVTGPGGAGKTRLALEVARHAAAGHPDGVHLVELAGSPAGAVVAEVAAALDVREQPGEPIERTVADRLRHGRALLVLDNCEHVADVAARLCATLLAGSAGLRVLATSREPLGVPGEVVRPLSGLAVSDDGGDAVRLLVDRATAARPGFRLDAADLPVAVRVCRRLDGLPLAIELAAARLRSSSLPEVAARLDQRLGLLTGGGRAAPERHRTMRAALEWGHQLLDPDERRLFRRLGVFAGFGADALPVVDGSPDVLHRLVDRSMVVAEPAAGGTRYRLLETMNEYAAGLLDDAGEAARYRHRHAEWCRGLAERYAAPGSPTPEELARLLPELDNVRAALAWCASHDPALGLAVATPLWWFWWVRGLMAEGLAALTLLLERAGPVPDRAGALRAAAALARNSGQLAAARRFGDEALALFRSRQDSAGVATALNNLCITAQAQGDFAASLAYGQECLELSGTLGDGRRVAAVQNNTAGTLRCLDRLPEARELFTAALDGFRSLGDLRGEAAATCNLAIVSRRSGAVAESYGWWARALALYTELEIAEGQLDVLEGVACGWSADRPAAALRLLLVGDRERRRLGAPVFTPDEIADRDAAFARCRAAVPEPASLPSLDEALELVRAELAGAV